MNELNLIPNWKPGDTRVLSNQELDTLYLGGFFDSYSQVYNVDGMRWKVSNEVHKKDSTAEITLVCVE